MRRQPKTEGGNSAPSTCPRLCNLAMAPSPHHLSHRQARTNFLKFLRHRSTILASPVTALAAVTGGELKQTESKDNHDPSRRDRSSEKNDAEPEPAAAMTLSGAEIK